MGDLLVIYYDDENVDDDRNYDDDYIDADDADDGDDNRGEGGSCCGSCRGG